MTSRRRLSLQVRLVIVLLIISLVPLAVSAFLIRQIAEVAQNFASNHAARLRPPLERSEASFAELIDAKKELFRAQTDLITVDPAVRSVETSRADLETRLSTFLESSGDLLGLELLESGAVVISVSRPSPSRTGLSHYREVTVERSFATGDRTIRARFAADLTITEDLEAVRTAIKLSHRVDAVRDSLPSGYVVAFLALVGGVVVVVTIFGIVVARRLSRRIETLLVATRQLASGDLEASAEIHGRDELAELAGAFNSMVAELRSDRAQILYLQRIGAWQDVARRLAHEIKNPLTPIQLAMQQVVSSYNGDDEKFAKLLNDADEIVGEEITSLRRLVDAFSALGRLPRPEAKSLDIAVVLDDLQKDPVFAENPGYRCARRRCDGRWRSPASAPPARQPGRERHRGGRGTSLCHVERRPQPRRGDHHRGRWRPRH